MKSIMCVFMMALVLFSSCNHEEEVIGNEQTTSGQAIARFKSYFYKDGTVNASKLERHSETEWAVATDNGGRACEVFMDITGVETSLKGKYEYNYVSSDGKCSIRLTGNVRADEDAVYAVFYVQIPECPEFGKIYVTTREYFKEKNGEGVNSFDGVPVIF